VLATVHGNEDELRRNMSAAIFIIEEWKLILRREEIDSARISVGMSDWQLVSLKVVELLSVVGVHNYYSFTASTGNQPEKRRH
jgi:hypothetical protein